MKIGKNISTDMVCFSTNYTAFDERGPEIDDEVCSERVVANRNVLGVDLPIVDLTGTI